MYLATPTGIQNARVCEYNPSDVVAQNLGSTKKYETSRVICRTAKFDLRTVGVQLLYTDIMPA
jgi:hypothetical protein